MSTQNYEREHGTDETGPLQPDAIDVLSDNLWHMAFSISRFTLRENDYDPLTLNVSSMVDTPLHAREVITDEEPTYPFDFIRDQGSWGREGEALSCCGVARVEERDTPVRLLVWSEAGGTGIFVHSIEPQPTSRR